MRSTYLVMSQTGTILSKAIKGVTGDEYNHISISLDPSLECMYSFGRKYSNIPFIGAFVQEGKSIGTFSKFPNTICKVIKIDVDDEVYSKICCIIFEMLVDRKKYKYNLLGLFLALFDIEYHSQRKFYCSEFVKYILEEAEINVDFLSSIPRPSEFENIENGEVIYDELLRNYPDGSENGCSFDKEKDQKKVLRKVISAFRKTA